MPQVQINTPAPDFNLTDYHGQPVSLAQFKNRQNILLVFNRGFI